MKTGQLAGDYFSAVEYLRTRQALQQQELAQKEERKRRSWVRKFKRKGFTVLAFTGKSR